MTNKDFSDAVQELLTERDMSQRELARRARSSTGTDFPHASTVNQAVIRAVAPTMPLMEAVASAFNISPDHFAEYRLADLRRRLDPAQVGLENALWTLSKFRE